MKARALTDNLKEAVAWIKPGKPKGIQSLPALDNVLIEATHQGLRFTLTDLELTVSAFTGGKIAKTGATTVPFKEFERLVKSLPKEEVASFETERKVEGNWISETCTVGIPSLSVAFKAIPFDEFPATRRDLPWYVAPNPQGLLNACRLIKHGIATDDCRPALQYAQLHNGQLASANGFVLPYVDLPSLKEERPIYFCKRLAEFLARQKAEPTKLRVNFEEHRVAVWFGDNYAEAVMYDGRWPDWKQIIPQHRKFDIRVNYASLLGAVKLLRQLSPISDILRFACQDSVLTISARERETFEATQRLEATISGETDGEFGLNANYIFNTLKVRSKELGDKDYVSIQGTNPSSPFVVADARSELREIIMPMHIGK